MKLLTRFLNFLHQVLQYFAPSKPKQYPEPIPIQICTPGTHEYYYYTEHRTRYRCCKNCPYTEYRYYEDEPWKPAQIIVHGTNKHGKLITSVKP